MESFIPEWVIALSSSMLGLAALICLYQIVRGPTLADRAIGLDALSICIIGALSLYSLKVVETVNLSVVLLIAILGFVGLVVAANYIGGGGDVVDRD